MSSGEAAQGGEEAWVTLVTNDSYGLGALVVARSLRRVNTTKKLAVMITPGVTAHMRNALGSEFDVVEEVNVLDSQDSANLALLTRPELGITFTKLHCWRLTQFSKCVFLDADTLILQNCDELFNRSEFSAAPDVGWPDCFNSGVFVFKPSIETYNQLLAFAVTSGSFDGGDQGLLNMYFSDWSVSDIGRHLPFIYNTVATAAYSYLPAFKAFGSNVKIIHFIGPEKPWLMYFDSATGSVKPPPGQEYLHPLLQSWWDIFRADVHNKLSPEMGAYSDDSQHDYASGTIAEQAGLAGTFAQISLEGVKSDQQIEHEEQLRKHAWESGHIDYMGKDSFENIMKKIQCSMAQGAPPPGPPAPTPVETPPPEPRRKSKSPSPPKQEKEKTPPPPPPQVQEEVKAEPQPQPPAPVVVSSADVTDGPAVPAPPPVETPKVESPPQTQEQPAVAATAPPPPEQQPPAPVAEEVKVEPVAAPVAAPEVPAPAPETPKPDAAGEVKAEEKVPAPAAPTAAPETPKPEEAAPAAPQADAEEARLLEERAALEKKLAEQKRIAEQKLQEEKLAAEERAKAAAASAPAPDPQPTPAEGAEAPPPQPPPRRQSKDNSAADNNSSTSAKHNGSSNKGRRNYRPYNYSNNNKPEYSRDKVLEGESSIPPHDDVEEVVEVVEKQVQLTQSYSAMTNSSVRVPLSGVEKRGRQGVPNTTTTPIIITTAATTTKTDTPLIVTQNLGQSRSGEVETNDKPKAPTTHPPKGSYSEIAKSSKTPHPPPPIESKVVQVATTANSSVPPKLDSKPVPPPPLSLIPAAKSSRIVQLIKKELQVNKVGAAPQPQPQTSNPSSKSSGKKHKKKNKGGGSKVEKIEVKESVKEVVEMTPSSTTAILAKGGNPPEIKEPTIAKTLDVGESKKPSKSKQPKTGNKSKNNNKTNKKVTNEASESDDDIWRKYRTPLMVVGGCCVVVMMLSALYFYSSSFLSESGGGGVTPQFPSSHNAPIPTPNPI